MGSFETISHEWLIKFIEHRIGDRRIVRLTQKWLRAGVLEEGQWTQCKWLPNPRICHPYPSLKLLVRT